MTFFRPKAARRRTDPPSPPAERAALSRPFVWPLLVATAGLGCAGRGNVDVLESRLRDQEDRLFALEDQLDKAASELAAARQQSEAYRRQLAGQGTPLDSPEQADALFRAKALKINKLRCGGLDQDGLPGDDVLAASLTPVDAQGEVVKVPGAIELELLDSAQPEGRQQIGRWEFNAADAPRHWHAGILGSGYQFTLPWQHAPTSRELWLHARLTTVDGRRFEAREQVRVTPPLAGAGPDLPGVARVSTPGPNRPAATAQPAAPVALGAIRPTGHSRPNEPATDGDALRQAAHQEDAQPADPNAKPADWWE
jgi:hypothetical protein